MSYSAKDAKGNEYLVEAEEGTIDQNYSNFIFKIRKRNNKIKKL